MNPLSVPMISFQHLDNSALRLLTAIPRRFRRLPVVIVHCMCYLVLCTRPKMAAELYMTQSGILREAMRFPPP